MFSNSILRCAFFNFSQIPKVLWFPTFFDDFMMRHFRPLQSMSACWLFFASFLRPFGGSFWASKGPRGKSSAFNKLYETQRFLKDFGFEEVEMFVHNCQSCMCAFFNVFPEHARSTIRYRLNSSGKTTCFWTILKLRSFKVRFLKWAKCRKRYVFHYFEPQFSSLARSMQTWEAMGTPPGKG